MTAGTVTRAAYWQHRRTGAHDEFRAARDLLLRHRLDHDAAVAEFRWPRPERFNWALEWFDVIAEDNHGPALELIDGQGARRAVSFSALSLRSDAVAAWLTGLGVSRGDRVLAVLSSQQELWETLLACLKVGAVAIPTYTSLTEAEAADRIRRGRIQHLICRAELVPLFAGTPLPGLRVAVPCAE